MLETFCKSFKWKQVIHKFVCGVEVQEYEWIKCNV